MDFATMGTIGSYVKRQNLTFAAKHKIRTGQTLTNANGNLLSMTTSTFNKLREAAKASTDQAKQQKLARIKQKLKAGQKLTDEELGFLRTNDPKTYKKAKAADDAREELKSELKKAKSKSEAREAMTRAMIKASTTAMAELSALGQGGGNSSAGGNVAQGGEVMSSGEAGNVSGGEVSAEGNTNISGTENQSFGELNQSIQASDDKTSADKNSSAQKTSEDSDDMTPEDIMEKYIWTIRALEDEWMKFTNSKEYRDLPDQTKDEKAIGKKKIYKQVEEPGRRVLDAVTAYRKSMTLIDSLIA